MPDDRTKVPDPFGGLFGRDDPRVRRGSRMLALPAARRWFGVVGWGVENDLYIYQQPLAGRAGPRAIVSGREVLVLGSYDYLGLLGHPAIEEATIRAVRTYGTGAAGVRLLTGTTPLHRSLEEDISAFKGTASSLVFSSGYAANVGAIVGLLGPRDRALLDEAAHRSLFEGCAAARVPTEVFPHGDLGALRALLEKDPARRTLIAVDALYSMDGDLAPLPQLVALKREFGAMLLVDEAHAIGVVGETGRGLHEHFHLDPGDVDVWTGSLSKAIPSTGGYVAGSKALVVFLQHAAPGFFFSAALGPPAVAAAREAIRVIEAEPWRIGDAARAGASLREGLRGAGFDTGRSVTPLVSVVLGGDEEAYRFAREVLEEGVLAPAIVPPAVPNGASRVRLCATAAHTPKDIEQVVGAFRAARERTSAPPSLVVNPA